MQTVKHSDDTRSSKLSAAKRQKRELPISAHIIAKKATDLKQKINITHAGVIGFLWFRATL